MVPVVLTAMVFAQSSPGVSHTRIGARLRPALDKSIRAFLLAVEGTRAHHAERAVAPARRGAALAGRSSGRRAAARDRWLRQAGLPG